MYRSPILEVESISCTRRPSLATPLPPTRRPESAGPRFEIRTHYNRSAPRLSRDLISSSSKAQPQPKVNNPETSRTKESELQRKRFSWEGELLFRRLRQRTLLAYIAPIDSTQELGVSRNN